MKRILLFAILAIALCATAASAKKLIVATDTNFPPFEFKDPETGKHTGFDVELWDAIAKEIGAEYDLQPMDFNGIIPGLQSGQIDVGIAGMTIKPERAEVVDFSDPYYNAGLLILVKADNAEITDVKSLAGKIVATKLGTTSEDFAKKEAGAKEVKLFPNNDAMFMELMAGGADAVIFDSPVISEFVRTVGKEQTKIVGPCTWASPTASASPRAANWSPRPTTPSRSSKTAAPTVNCTSNGSAPSPSNPA